MALTLDSTIERCYAHGVSIIEEEVPEYCYNCGSTREVFEGVCAACEADALNEPDEYRWREQ
jgi:hypothetical protein